MSQNSRLPLNEEAKELWEAALAGWDVSQGDMEVSYQEFQTFLLPFYKSVQARLDRMKAMRLYGYIDFPDGNPGRGNKKTVKVFSVVGKSGNIDQPDVAPLLSEVARVAGI